jgi:hypothetical protein
MRVILELDAEVARLLQQPRSTTTTHSGAAELQQVAAQRGLQLQPLHPGVADARLAGYFFVDIADAAATGEALDRLRRCRAVTAAYTKPADAAPQ